MNIPLVTIRCITYNHEPYIRECLEGFVMQQTNFKFEAVVHDDASTDGTAVIIAEFAAKYPDIIKPIYETENQYSKKDGSLNRIMNAHMRGKYIAMCEGDDYWTDPHKLQKQVDFLEANPEYSMCFHHAKIVLEKGIESSIKYNPPENREYSIRVIEEHWGIPTASIVYREEFIITNYPKWVVSGDRFVVFSLAQRGKIYGFSFTGSVYRRHRRGVSISMLLSIEGLRKTYIQYSKMEKMFPEISDILSSRTEMYYEALHNVPYYRGITKYRLLNLVKNPSKLVSKNYIYTTILFAFMDMKSLLSKQNEDS